MFIVKVFISSRIQRGRHWLFLLVITFCFQASFFIIFAGTVFAAGGSHLDVMRLLSSADDASRSAHMVYLSGIIWEEIAKLVLLIIIFRSVPLEVRSINSFLLAGVVFGGCEGISTIALTVSAYASGPSQIFTNYLVGATMLASRVFAVILVHSLLMLVYGLTPGWTESIWIRVLMPLMVATALHLAYNHFIATNPFSLEDGPQALIQPAGFLIVAAVALYLRWVESASAVWGRVSRSLPFCAANPA
ncbi:hypothetical protein [Aestuariivirga sp.]|uniref:hypothetical protein n=1 Tax=Aestuariivirga sp. TaxID=2650926 RepID=UPI003BADB573